jgi:hypothetical protein
MKLNPRGKFKNAAPNILHGISLYFFSSLFRVKKTSRKFETLGELIGFQSWIKGTFGDTPIHLRREVLWKKIISTSSKSEKLIIIELGVAWGYVTNWFVETGFDLCTDQGFSSIKIESFDLFTGLPTDWRSHPKGFFSNGGCPPNILDKRVTFHVGDVRDKITDLEPLELEKSRLIVLFDLDLLAPTLAVWEYLRTSLKAGDILYFDEAFDADEREILNKHVLVDFIVASIGCTSLALAVEIVGTRTQAK